MERSTCRKHVPSIDQDIESQTRDLKEDVRDLEPIFARLSDNMIILSFGNFADLQQPILEPN